MADYTEDDKYAIILSKMLSEVSTPIEDCDYFAGRIVEAIPDSGMDAPSPLIYSNGHASLEYERLLKVGLSGILSDIKEIAKRKGDSESLSFAKNAEIAAFAVRDYANRYSKAAEEKGFFEMAKALLTDKMNVYNYPQTAKYLIEKGIPENISKDYTYSACCTFDLNYHTIRREYFVPFPQIFLKVLHSKSYNSVEEILSDFEIALTKNIQSYADRGQKPWGFEYAKKMFVLDSLLFTDTAKECHYACDSTPPYNLLNIFGPGVATIGDSLMVLDKLIFKEKRFGYEEFIEILDKNYEGYEDLRQEILDFTRFGNDTENDNYTVLAGNTFINAVDKVCLFDNFYAIPGFYSLERDNVWKDEVDATPDGRLACTPFSENQWPTYGADKKGITSLLNSVSKLPLDKTATGGFNIAFAQKTPAHLLKALVLGFFDNGGFHVGVTVMDREMLLDAMEHPEKYQSLTVRLYGFSEYFVNLPKWQQLAVINRTDYLV